jgi:multidrug transporter EmrE-like cation transporter
MNSSSNFTFWLTIAAVVGTGTLGGILYKYGTTKFGGIDFRRFLQVDLNVQTIGIVILVITGALMVLIGGYLLGPRLFLAEYVFSAEIFLALILLFISRVLMGIPLSVTGLGKLTALLTASLVASTAVASAFLFKESFSLRAILGIVLAVVAIALIGEPS